MSNKKNLKYLMNLLWLFTFLSVLSFSYCEPCETSHSSPSNLFLLPGSSENAKCWVFYANATFSWNLHFLSFSLGKTAAIDIFATDSVSGKFVLQKTIPGSDLVPPDYLIPGGTAKVVYRDSGNGMTNLLVASLTLKAGKVMLYNANAGSIMKNTWLPWVPMDLYLLLVCTFSGIFTAGWAGLLVVTFTYAALSSTVLDSIIISHSTLVGMLAANFLVFLYRYRKRDRICDYNAVLFLTPAIFLGTSVSLFCVYMLAISKTVSGLLFIGLAFGIYKSVRLGLSARKAWNIELDEAALNKTHTLMSEDQEVLVSGADDMRTAYATNIQREFNHVKREESRVGWPWFLLFIVISVMVVGTVLRGSPINGSSPVNVVTCTKTWGYIVLGTFLVLPFFSMYPAATLSSHFRTKMKLGMHTRTGETHWTAGNLAAIWLICGILGGVACLVGIPAGIFAAPMFIHLGMLPDVAISSATLVSLFSSFLMSLNFNVFGQLGWDYFGFYFACGFLGSLIGWGLSFLINSGRRRGSIIRIVSSVVLGSIMVWLLCIVCIRLTDNWSTYKPTWLPFCQVMGRPTF